jgi:hypothetical protein
MVSVFRIDVSQARMWFVYIEEGRAWEMLTRSGTDPRSSSTHFCPEDEDSKFLRSVGSHLQDRVVPLLWKPQLSVPTWVISVISAALLVAASQCSCFRVFILSYHFWRHLALYKIPFPLGHFSVWGTKCWNAKSGFYGGGSVLSRTLLLRALKELVHYHDAWSMSHCLLCIWKLVWRP